MSRLLATLRCDTRLQRRNGFWYAAGFVVLYSVVLLHLLSPEPRLVAIAPFVWSNLLVNTFYFLAGLVLLEKREGTLEALVVTPLRTGEYVTSKLATLTALGFLENLVIVLLTHGAAFRPAPFAAGVVLASVLYCLLGLAFVVRYDSINEYLIPSAVFTALLGAPLLSYFGIWDGPWMALHPLHGPLVLLNAAFLPVGPAEQLRALLASAAWIVPALLWSRVAFRRFVVAPERRRRWA